jgi:hypothetical protein
MTKRRDRWLVCRGRQAWIFSGIQGVASRPADPPFVRAGETGSFSRIARESLEARLDMKLLLRTTRHVAPTDPAGCFSNGRGTLSDFDDAQMPRAEQTACAARCG